MTLDRVRAEAQLLGDLGIGQALAGKAEDFRSRSVRLVLLSASWRAPPLAQ